MIFRPIKITPHFNEDLYALVMADFGPGKSIFITEPTADTFSRVLDLTARETKTA